MSGESLRPLPSVWASRRFVKGLYRSPRFLAQASGAFDDLLRRFTSQQFPLTGYDRVSGLKPGSGVYEVKISAGDRMLVHWAGTSDLVLLDVGDHDVVPRYDDTKLAHDLGSLGPAPPRFLRPGGIGLLDRSGDSIVRPFAGVEDSPAWTVHLDEPQMRVLELVQDAVTSGDSSRFLILGGPGTGKTAILGAVLAFLMDNNYDVGFVSTDVVREFLEISWLRELDQVASTVWDSRDVLLIDDPLSLYEARAALRPGNSSRVVVVALDPLQLLDTISDSDLEELSELVSGRMVWLPNCYRQKENISSQVLPMLNAVAASTPHTGQGAHTDFAAARTQINARANELHYVNPGGYVKVYRDYVHADVEAEALRLLGSPLWSHWDNLLIVDDSIASEEDIFSLTKGALLSRFVSLADVQRIKGAEFQHAVVFLDTTTYDALLHGSRGMSEEAYALTRLTRIPLTRSKDSLVIFLGQSQG